MVNRNEACLDVKDHHKYARIISARTPTRIDFQIFGPKLHAEEVVDGGACINGRSLRGGRWGQHRGEHVACVANLNHSSTIGVLGAILFKIAS